MLNANQLVWRCRRGVRELDVLFGRFLDTEYQSLTDSQKLSFEKLLEVQDPTIMDWLFAREAPDDEGLKELVAHLRVLSGL